MQVPAFRNDLTQIIDAIKICGYWPEGEKPPPQNVLVTFGAYKGRPVHCLANGPAAAGKCEWYARNFDRGKYEVFFQALYDLKVVKPPSEQQRVPAAQQKRDNVADVFRALNDEGGSKLLRAATVRPTQSTAQHGPCRMCNKMFKTVQGLKGHEQNQTCQKAKQAKIDHNKQRQRNTPFIIKSAGSTKQLTITDLIGGFRRDVAQRVPTVQAVNTDTGPATEAEDASPPEEAPAGHTLHLLPLIAHTHTPLLSDGDEMGGPEPHVNVGLTQDNFIGMVKAIYDKAKYRMGACRGDFKQQDWVFSPDCPTMTTVASHDDFCVKRVKVWFPEVMPHTYMHL